MTVVSVQWFGSEAVELTYKTQAGAVANELLYRHDETRLEVVALGRPWSFDGDGALFRLVSEAQRIRLAHLFDPLLAIHTSVVDPLPHQITGVYDAMLPRQPLRFLLADDPGAGKTIMAGLLIKELVARGDLERCLIVCPGSLAEQWQDELYRRFQLPFRSGPHPQLVLETDLVIARLVCRPGNTHRNTRHLVDDRLRGGDPDERRGGGIVRVDERLDRVHEIGDAAERTPLDRPLAEQAEPPLHLVQPGRRGGREVQMEAGVAPPATA